MLAELVFERGSGLPASLKTVHLNAAGIDVGEHYVAVPADRDAQL